MLGLNDKIPVRAVECPSSQKIGLQLQSPRRRRIHLQSRRLQSPQHRRLQFRRKVVVFPEFATAKVTGEDLFGLKLVQ